MAVLSPSDEPWMNLSIGVVQRAVEDYRLALYSVKFGGNPARKAKDLEDWFRSEWGQLVCCGQGEYIINRVKEDVRLGRYYRP